MYRVTINLFPPAINTKNTGYGVWHGSGIFLIQHPYYKSALLEYPKEPDKCDVCGSRDTLCICFEYYADLVGKEGLYELECKSCGKYTTYHYFD